LSYIAEMGASPGQISALLQDTVELLHGSHWILDIAPEHHMEWGISRKSLDIFTYGKQDPKALRATRATRNGPQSQVRKGTGTACFQRRRLKQSQHSSQDGKAWAKRSANRARTGSTSQIFPGRQTTRGRAFGHHTSITHGQCLATVVIFWRRGEASRCPGKSAGK
jgi:hypothetical protein